MPRTCEVEGCDHEAGIGIQFVLASDERMSHTRWVCTACLASTLRMLADATDTATTIAAVLWAKRIREAGT